MALETDPLDQPSSLGAQSGNDCAENNNTEVSTTIPDQLKLTKGTDKQHLREITVNRSSVGQGWCHPFLTAPTQQTQG